MIVKSECPNTKIRKASDSIHINGKAARGMSIAVNVTEGIVIPIQVYLLECFIRVGDHWRTVEKHSHVLAAWYDYLSMRGIELFNAHEGHLRNFLLGGGSRGGNLTSIGTHVSVVSSPTNRQKFIAIVAFYDFWERKRGISFRQTGSSIAKIREEVLHRPHRSISKAIINFSRTAEKRPKRRKRAPTESEMQLLLEKVAERNDENRADTYYLIACLGRYAGSRAMGISSLHVGEFIECLMREPELKNFRPKSQNWGGYLEQGDRREIIDALKKMRQRGLLFIYCNVANKGGGWTQIPIPMELCEDLVDYIWTRRQELWSRMTQSSRKEIATNVFLSYKGGALTQEAIVNYFNEKFKELGVDATFHKLRAAFIQEVVKRAYLFERGLNGSAWQVETVLEIARQRLGHKSNKSLKYYLDNILAEEIIQGHPIVVSEEKDADLLRAVAEKMNDDSDDTFGESFRTFLAEIGVEPLPEKRSYRTI